MFEQERNLSQAEIKMKKEQIKQELALYNKGWELSFTTSHCSDIIEETRAIGMAFVKDNTHTLFVSFDVANWAEEEDPDESFIIKAFDTTHQLEDRHEGSGLIFGPSYTPDDLSNGLSSHFHSIADLNKVDEILENMLERFSSNLVKTINKL